MQSCSRPTTNPPRHPKPGMGSRLNNVKLFVNENKYKIKTKPEVKTQICALWPPGGRHLVKLESVKLKYININNKTSNKARCNKLFMYTKYTKL